jgi:hypothetical protein
MINRPDVPPPKSEKAKIWLDCDTVFIDEYLTVNDG